MRHYVGVTIGPIGDTIGDASSPAALWFASSMFSDITRRLCKAIEERFAEAEIYSPFYDESRIADDGVGKFHDRVFFSTADFSHETMKQIIDEVKRGTCAIFPSNNAIFQTKAMEAFFQQYLQIHFIAMQEDEVGENNCVLLLSPYLDTLELMKTFPKNDCGDPIQALFRGEKDNYNKYIKESLLFQTIDKKDNQFIHPIENRIYTLEEIASCHGMGESGTKKAHYFAVVSADGDGMGKFLEGLGSAEVTDFSECCLEYDMTAAKMIGDFGGMTIYAGGDDLLFLAPVVNESGEDVIGLCNRIGSKFREIIGAKSMFAGNPNIPTISFGVSVQYKKFPLYEALQKSRILLALAKKDGDFAKVDCVKNNILLNVQKHSGQSFSVLLGNEACDTFEDILHCKDSVADGETIQSVLYTLSTFKSLLFVLNQKARESEIPYEMYETAWLNLFDNAGQKKAESYVKSVCRKYFDYLVNDNVRMQIPAGDKMEEFKKDASLKVLIGILQFRKFLEEKEGER